VLCMSILGQVDVIFLSLYHVEVSVVVFMCLSVCLSVCLDLCCIQSSRRINVYIIIIITGHADKLPASGGNKFAYI